MQAPPRARKRVEAAAVAGVLKRQPNLVIQAILACECLRRAPVVDKAEVGRGRAGGAQVAKSKRR